MLVGEVSQQRRLHLEVDFHVALGAEILLGHAVFAARMATRNHLYWVLKQLKTLDARELVLRRFL